MCMDIQLVEALCGFQKPISTLDNRTIVITSHPGQIVKHGDIKCVLNEGMPIYRRPYEKGRLIIEFKVSYKVAWEYLTMISLLKYNRITFLDGKAHYSLLFRKK